MNEKLIQLIASKIFWIIIVSIIIGGFVIISALSLMPHDTSTNQEQGERRSPFTVRERTEEMWRNGGDYDYDE